MSIIRFLIWLPLAIPMFCVSVIKTIAKKVFGLLTIFYKSFLAKGWDLLCQILTGIAGVVQKIPGIGKLIAWFILLPTRLRMP